MLVGSTPDASLPVQRACAMCGAALAGLYCHACGQPSRAARRPLREALAGQTGRAMLYAERVERRFQSPYTLLIALSSMAYAGALAAVHRRSRKPWLVRVAAAIHHMCAVFVISLAAFVAGRALGWSYFDNLAAWNVAVNVIGFAYLMLMIRRVYAEPWPRVLAKSAVVLVAGSLSDTLTFIASLNVALRLG